MKNKERAKYREIIETQQKIIEQMNTLFGVLTELLDDEEVDNG